MPKVSIVIPAYNPGPYLKEALDSVVAQTFTDWECVVIDDGSSEDLLWVDGYAPGIRLIQQENAGVSVARNRGILDTTAPYIAFLDADDYWTIEKLQRQVELMEANPDVGMSYHRYHFIDDAKTNMGGGPHAQQHDYYTLLQGCSISASTVMLRRVLLAHTGMFEAGMKTGEDWAVWLKYAMITRLQGLDIDMAVYRKHGYNATSDYHDIYKSVMRIMNGHKEQANSVGDKRAISHIKAGVKFYRRIYSSREYDAARIDMNDGRYMYSLGKIFRAFSRDPVFTLGSMVKWLKNRW